MQGQGDSNATYRIDASVDMSHTFVNVAILNSEASGVFTYEDATPGYGKFYRVAIP